MDKDLIEKYKNEMLRMYRSSPAARFQSQTSVPEQNPAVMRSTEEPWRNTTDPSDDMRNERRPIDEPWRSSADPSDDMRNERRPIDEPWRNTTDPSADMRNERRPIEQPWRNTTDPSSNMRNERRPIEEPRSSITNPPADMRNERRPVQNPDYGENGRIISIITTVNKAFPVPNAKVSIFTGDYDSDEMNVIDTDTSDRSGKTKPFILPAPPRELSLQAGSAQAPYALYNMLVEADGYINNVHMNIPVFRGVTSLQNSNLVLRPSDKPDSNIIMYDESLTYDL